MISASQRARTIGLGPVFSTPALCTAALPGRGRQPAGGPGASSTPLGLLLRSCERAALGLWGSGLSLLIRVPAWEKSLGSPGLGGLYLDSVEVQG